MSEHAKFVKFQMLTRIMLPRRSNCPMVPARKCSTFARTAFARAESVNISTTGQLGVSLTNGCNRTSATWIDKRERSHDADSFLDFNVRLGYLNS